MAAAFCMFETDNLDEVYNFNEMTLTQKGDIVDEIFNKGNSGNKFLVKS